MAPPNNPQVARVAIIMGRDNRQEVNTLHFQKGGWSIGDLVTLANAVKLAWDTYYKPTVGAWVSLNQVQCRVYDPALPLAYDLTVSPPSTGSHSGGELPGNVTSTLSWRTGLAGRRYRGRIYHAGPSSDSVGVTDILASAFMTLLLNLGTHLLNDPATAAAAVPVVFHKNTNTFTAITAVVIESILDSQRRRLPGRGR